LCTKRFQLNQESHEAANFSFTNNMRNKLNSNRQALSYEQIILITSIRNLDRRLQALSKKIQTKKTKEIKRLKWNFVAILMDRLLFYIALTYFSINLSHFMINMFFIES
jgi:hypothetical protein